MTNLERIAALQAQQPGILPSWMSNRWTTGSAPQANAVGYGARKDEFTPVQPRQAGPPVIRGPSEEKTGLTAGIFASDRSALPAAPTSIAPALAPTAPGYVPPTAMQMRNASGQVVATTIAGQKFTKPISQAFIDSAKLAPDATPTDRAKALSQSAQEKGGFDMDKFITNQNNNTLTTLSPERIAQGFTQTNLAPVFRAQDNTTKPVIAPNSMANDRNANMEAFGTAFPSAAQTNVAQMRQQFQKQMTNPTQ